MKTKLKDMNLVQLRNHALRLGIPEKELAGKDKRGIRALIVEKAGGRT